jgi:hypothetical protein
MKAGDRVKVVGIPPDVHDDVELRTRALFEKCVGGIFEVLALENVAGLDAPLLRLDVGQMVGAEPWEHTIWIEPNYAEVVDSKANPPQ